MKERFIENGIEYVKCGDYYLPNFELPQNQYEIGKYSRMRLQFLKTSKPCRYSTLLMTGKLNEHLHEVDVQAEKILEQFIKSAEQTAPDKATHQMEWVGYMNNAKSCAEEVILERVVYAESRNFMF
ncbi:TnpV protein [Qingrenia yutianensis]|uniref:TnpV protein n=1 Tax=Qingrenia yutianensis TaxID=2763676 RepID=A0A926F5U6_9FIRM|nr:TnpV protein [Qingrenia yutianensis]MBC8596313.1 TnpV protein [Qingrenia yutianensis]